MLGERDLIESPELGRAISGLIEKRGWAKRTAAERIQVAPPTLYEAMAGRLTRKTLKKMAKAFQVPIEEFEAIAAGDELPAPEAVETEEGGSLRDFVSNLERIQRTLRGFPGGDTGHELKIGFLNQVERAARETGNPLPPEYWQIRRRVHEGDL